jgi:hypothetical protein
VESGFFSAEFFKLQTFPVPQSSFVRSRFQNSQFLPARLDDTEWQPEFMGPFRSYERETLVAELDPHTGHNVVFAFWDVNALLNAMRQVFKL